jgi:hypothetical protein
MCYVVSQTVMHQYMVVCMMLTACKHAVVNTSTVESVRAPCVHMMVLNINTLGQTQVWNPVSRFI